MTNCNEMAVAHNSLFMKYSPVIDEPRHTQSPSLMMLRDDEAESTLSRILQRYGQSSQIFNTLQSIFTFNKEFLKCYIYTL